MAATLPPADAANAPAGSPVRQEICLCNGTAQFLLLAAALREDEARDGPSPVPRHRVFVLSAHSSGDAFRAALHDAVARSGLAAKIVCCWDWPEWNGFFGDAKPWRTYRFIRGLLGVQAPATVWLSRLPLPLDRLVACVYDQAELVVYEEGTLSYTTTYATAGWRDRLADSAPGTALKLRLLPIGKRRGFAGGIAGSLLKRVLPSYTARRADLERRVTRFYGTLVAQLGRPALPAHVELHAVRPASILEAMRHFPAPVPALPTPAQVGKARRAVVLGLPYRHVEKQGIARDDIRAFYLEWLSALVAAGYQVVWKSHPRDTSDLPDFLRERLGPAFVVLDGHADVPVEVLYPALAPDLVIASISTSLFSARSMHGLPVATYARAMAARLGYPNRPTDLERLEGIADVASFC